jgi:hypothetical protein
VLPVVAFRLHGAIQPVAILIDGLELLVGAKELGVGDVAAT